MRRRGGSNGRQHRGVLADDGRGLRDGGVAGALHGGWGRDGYGGLHGCPGNVPGVGEHGPVGLAQGVRGGRGGGRGRGGGACGGVMMVMMVMVVV